MSNLEIDVGAHGMMFSVDRQVYGDEKFGVRGVEGTAQTEIADKRKVSESARIDTRPSRKFQPSICATT